MISENIRVMNEAKGLVWRLLREGQVDFLVKHSGLIAKSQFGEFNFICKGHLGQKVSLTEEEARMLEEFRKKKGTEKEVKKVK